MRRAPVTYLTGYVPDRNYLLRPPRFGPREGLPPIFDRFRRPFLPRKGTIAGHGLSPPFRPVRDRIASRGPPHPARSAPPGGRAVAGGHPGPGRTQAGITDVAGWQESGPVKRPRVVVVGSANTDMVVKAPRIPAPGETVLGGAFVMAAGGKGANQAVAAARLGAEVSLVARLGADSLGDAAIAGYARDGILTDLVVRDPDRPTGVALILVDDRGENSITVALGANEALSPEDVDRAADRIRTAAALVMQLEVPLAAVTRAARLAREAGVPVILDPAPAPDGGLPAALLADVTCLKPNESEAERLTGIRVTDPASAERAARRPQGLGPPVVIVTLGSQGAVLVEGGAVHHVPAPAIAAVDTTAAGDAFTGALATAVAAGSGWEEAARRATAAGALAALRIGAQPSLPTRAEWEAFLTAAGTPPVRS